MKYTYKAIKNGKTIEGTADAASREALIATLSHQGIHPLSIKEGGGGKGFLKLGKKKVKIQDLVVFTRQLSTMVSAGVPLTRSLSTLASDTESPELKKSDLCHHQRGRGRRPARQRLRQTSAHILRRVCQYGPCR